MPISMNEPARYVTQEKVYTSPLLGPLTDRKITKYRKMGFYSQGAIVFRKEERQKKQNKKIKVKTKNNFLKELLEGLK